MEDYCNQTVIWKHITGSNEYSESVYADPLTIKCRKEQKIRLVRNKTGEQVTSDTRLYIPYPLRDAEGWKLIAGYSIEVDDLLDGRVVISILEQTDLDGKVEGYEVML